MSLQLCIQPCSKSFHSSNISLHPLSRHAQQQRARQTEAEISCLMSLCTMFLHSHNLVKRDQSQWIPLQSLEQLAVNEGKEEDKHWWSEFVRSCSVR